MKRQTRSEWGRIGSGLQRLVQQNEADSPLENKFETEAVCLKVGLLRLRLLKVQQLF